MTCTPPLQGRSLGTRLDHNSRSFYAEHAHGMLISTVFKKLTSVCSMDIRQFISQKRPYQATLSEDDIDKGI